MGEGLLPDLELQAYEHILLEQDWHADALAQVLGISIDSAGAIIDRLLSRGLLRRSPDEPGRVYPVPPSVGLASAVQEAERAIARDVERVREARRTMDELTLRYASLASRGTFEQLLGSEAVSSRIAQELRDAQRSVDAIVSRLPTAETLAAARAGDRELFDRAVRVRALYLAAHHRASAPLRDYLNWMVDCGADVRLAATLPTRLVVVDDTMALVAMDPDDATAGAYALGDRGLVQLVRTMFDTIWFSAIPVRSAPVPEAPLRTELELTVLRLLGQGHKDEAVARRVGMSLRSLRRLISRISEEIGANSRFELGVRSRERGWI